MVPVKAVVLDALVVALAPITALLFRFLDSGPVPGHFWRGLFIALPYFVVAYVAANTLLGVYRSPSLGRVSGAVGAAVVALIVVTVGLRSMTGFGGVPLSVILLGGLLTLAGMLAWRVGLRKLGRN